MANLTDTETVNIASDIYATIRVLVRLLQTLELGEEFDVTYGALVSVLRDMNEQKELNI